MIFSFIDFVSLCMNTNITSNYVMKPSKIIVLTQCVFGNPDMMVGGGCSQDLQTREMALQRNGDLHAMEPMEREE